MKDIVPSEILKHDYPQIVIKFYQDRVYLFKDNKFEELLRYGNGHNNIVI